jgi:AraC-like DNA-binding protein
MAIEGEAHFAGLSFRATALRPLVGAPWSLSCAASVDILPGLIVPDAHVEFVFQTGAPCATRLQGSSSLSPSPAAMIYAQRHGALKLMPTGENAIVAFRTTPAVASVILGRPLVDCWDRPIDLADLIGDEAGRLLAQLADRPAAVLERVLETWLLSRLTAWGAEHERNLRLQRTLLWRFSEESVSALADRVGVTARTLRRQFASHAGLSPKQLSMSGRILRACAELSDRRDLPIAEVALRVGFGDQAAFTNAFRHYVGMTPARLRAEPIVHCERPAS